MRNCSALTIVLLLMSAAFAQVREVSGTVTDRTGNAVANATLRDRAGHSTQTDDEGHFRLAEPVGELTVNARGFAVEHLSLAGREAATANLKIRLAIARPEEMVSVSAASAVLAPETTTFSAAGLRLAPTLSLDEALRGSPGFSLFRRAPSWSANPTTQGVSLQGTGSSAASRALVLQDGIPLNDPFGGWVYWQRVPTTAPERIELQTGGGSGLYGSDAIGGAISIVSPRAFAAHLHPTHGEVDFSYGNLNTPSGSGSISTTRGPWAGSGSLFGGATNGYIPVPLSLRGAADYFASSSYRGSALRVDRRLNALASGFLAASFYGESRQNGTRLQTNGATVRELRTGFDLDSERLGAFSGRVYGGTETLRQTFTSISADRNAEALTRNQGVPANQAGGSFLWSRPVAARQLVVAGFDLRYVEGESDEFAYVSGKLTSYLRNGGVQWRYGAFVEDRLRVSRRLLLTISARVDRWSDKDARSITVPLSSQAPTVRMALPSRSSVAFDPRVAVSYEASSRWTFSASAARAFRAPTLNELYRAFRLGNVSTLANATLRDERSTIVQGSVLYSPNSLTSFRATGFWNGIDDPVSSVTLSSTPVLITRQRQNLGSLRAAGMEAAVSLHVRALQVEAAYQYAHSTVTSFAADPTLVELWIPQVPRHSASARATYVRKLWTVVVDGRYFGRQFDDDRNQFPLTGAFVANAGITRALPRGFSAYVAADNLLDRRYAIARTPTLSTSPPTVARVGVRWESRER
ncbi:MAG TPA: TonB-dependent receptor [Candidatus Saccharimonadales bacterium]|nr:TonB-dependent receptor [Candidatus Saccharimonadales bacterium]